MKEALTIVTTTVLCACLISGFLWGVFSVAQGEINGAKWHAMASYIYGVLGIISLPISYLFTESILQD